MIDQAVAESTIQVDGRQVARLIDVRRAYREAHSGRVARTSNAHCARAIAVLEAADVIDMDSTLVWRV